MASMWRRAMLYLGLGPDEEYDDYDAVDERARVPMQAGSPQSRYPSVLPDHPDVQMSGAVRTINPQPVDGSSTIPKRSAVVRPIPASPSAKPHVLTPTSFNQAQELADKFKSNTPVIVNLQDVDRDLSRRLIDFASGLCYGLGGQMDKVAKEVYLLTPSNVEVSAEEKRRLQERGLYDS
jgi:cell division inhibitor SepF